MQLAEIKDLFASGRRFLVEQKPAKALAVVDRAILSCLSSGNEQHAMMAVGQALRAEILLMSAPEGVEHAAAMAKALAVSEPMISEDFENVAPVLLNAVRYYQSVNDKVQALAAARMVLSGCDTYYGEHHPRWFQLRRWLTEAGIPEILS